MSERTAKIFSLIILALSLMFLFATISYAQAPFAQPTQDPGTRLLDEQQRKRERERLENARPGQKILVPTPEKVEREDICFPVNTIRLRGVSVLDAKKLSGHIEAYKDTCMGQKAIGALLQLINKTYVEAGFITSKAYVPQQDLTKGELIIDVLEGRIEGFVYRIVDKNGKVEAGKPRKIALAFPIKPGEVFQLRAIEQGLDQINRLQSSQAKVDLLPGNQPGTSLVVITEQQVDRVRGTVSYDNKGSSSTGEDRHRVTLEADDTLALNEAYSFSYLGTKNTNVVSYNYSIPYGYWTLSTSGSYSESLDDLTPTSDLFNQTANANFRLERLFSRDGTQKTWGYVNAGYFWNSRFVNISQLEPQTRTHASIGLRTERYFEKGVLSADIGYTRGTPFLGADENFAVLTPDTPRAEFDKFDLSLNYLHRFENGSRLSSSLIGQWADVTLFSNQQLTIGGWDSVRGFHEDEASGERGLLSRNEFNFLLPEIKFDEKAGEKPNALEKFYNQKIRTSMQPYLFADAGYVENLGFDDNTTMIGTGFGFRGNLGRASFDAALAFPLTQNNSVEPGDIQGLINVSFKLF